VIRAAAIALALLLAGCTSEGQDLLRRDLQDLADLPKKLDGLARKDSAAQVDAAQPAPAPSPESQQPVAQSAALAPPPEENQAAPAATPPAPSPAPVQVAAKTKPKPTLFDALGITTPPPPPQGPQGAYDQIPDPIPVENPLARPPWEVFMEAGPNAHKELDLETLYGPGQIPAELMEQGEASPPQAGAEPQEVTPPLEAPPQEAAPAPEKKKKEKKGGVVIKAVAVPAVTGARGKGNSELTAAMRKALKDAGWPVLNAPRKDALTVRGKVVLGPPHGATQSVRLAWDVLTPDGKHLGDLKQDNAVPAGSLDQSWGENAGYAADAAAEGIFKLIQKYR
jgi:outer membrane murein-binding lipoprotein Lpp